MMQRRFVWPWVAVALCLVTTIAGRALAPSDIHDKHQWRTISYTVDMLEHGQWIMPRDTTGTLATKPPLYNWIGAGLAEVGGYSAFVFKLPSVLGLVLTVIAAGGVGLELGRRKRAFDGSAGQGEGRPSESAMNGAGAVLAAATAAVMLASPMTFKLAYLARPDMLLVATLTLAWWCADRVLRPTQRDKGTREVRWAMGWAWAWAMGFWISVSLAFLTKGPLAVVPVVYAVLAAGWVYGDWRRAWRFKWPVGLAVMLVMCGAWVIPAALQEPAFFTDRLLGKEMGNKSVAADPMGFFGAAIRVPAYFVSRGLPWTVLSLLGVLHFALHAPRPWSRKLQHPLGSPVLYLALILSSFLLMTEQRGDRLAPTYPAASALAAYLLLVGWKRYGVKTWHLHTASLVTVLALTCVYQWLMPQAKSRHGENIIAFAREVKQIVGRDAVRFEDTGSTPLQPLLGRNDAGETLPESHARWIIRPSETVHLDAPVPRLISLEVAEVYHPGPRPGRFVLLGPFSQD